MLFITVTPNQDTPGMLPNQNVKMMSLNSAAAATAQAASDTTGQVQAEPTAQPNDDAGDPADTASVSAEEVVNLAPCVLESETAVFTLTDDAFSQYLQSDVEDLVGKTITVYGYVYTSDSFPENTVLVARTMIACCAADASIVGFHVKVEEDAGLVKNEWVRVTGTVRSFVMEYYGAMYDSPILTAGLILRCETPDVEDAYIYP
jgi:putative membrane protein